LPCQSPLWRFPRLAPNLLCGVEAAIGLEKRANVATRGWFRLDPGQCRLVIDGPLDAEMVYLHARTPSVYGTAPRRLAGIQRLLVIAGYDAYPIDGVQGAKTQAAITKFLNDRKLPRYRSSTEFLRNADRGRPQPGGHRLHVVQRYSVCGDGFAGHC
jgi:Protein of unknown function (DUF1036)